MSIAIFDFDYTLFDTDSFLKNLAKVMELEFADFKESYQKEFMDKGIPYNAFTHLELLEKTDKEQNLKDLLEKSNEFIFPQAESVLEYFHKNTEMILASRGDPEYQQEKVENCGIKRFFNNIIISKDKLDSLSFLKGATAHLIFINDNGNECIKLKEEFPNAEIHLVKGPLTYNTEHSFPVHNNLNSLKELDLSN